MQDSLIQLSQSMNVMALASLFSAAASIGMVAAGYKSWKWMAFVGLAGAAVFAERAYSIGQLAFS